MFIPLTCANLETRDDQHVHYGYTHENCDHALQKKKRLSFSPFVW